MPEYENLRIYPKTKKEISNLSKKWEMTQVNFLESAMQYFKKTGVDPRDNKVLSPAEELKKFRDTIISFMRKQEKDYILPVFGNMEVLIARFMKYIDEEAPRKTESLPEGLNGPFKEDHKVEILQKRSPSGNLANELERERQKLSTLKEYFLKVLDHTEVKSTGLSKKPVIELPMGELNSIKEFLNRL